jgi:hypothetical protein
MLKTKQFLSKQEKFEIKVLINECQDIYGEFYLTKSKLRLFIKENIESLWKTLKDGDQIIYGEDAVAILTGYAEKTIEIIDNITNLKKIIPSRHYLVLLAKDEKNVNKLLKYATEKFRNINIYSKVKKDNPVLKCFYNAGFIFLHGRGKELLVYKKAEIKPEFIFRRFEDEKELVKKRIK